MIRLNYYVGSVRTQMTNAQNMNNSKMSTQKTPNLHAYYIDERKKWIKEG